MQCNLAIPAANPVQPDPKLQMSSALERTVWVLGRRRLRQCSNDLRFSLHGRTTTTQREAQREAQRLAPSFQSLACSAHKPGLLVCRFPATQVIQQRSPIRASSYEFRIIIGQSELL